MELELWKRELERQVADFMGQRDNNQWDFDPTLWIPLYEAGMSPEDALMEVLVRDFKPERV